MEAVRAKSRSSRNRVHLVTQARTPKSEDIGHRERRYLIMMAIRVVCFLAAIVMVSKGAGWLAAFPAVGAIVIPYFAVVLANGGREPNDTSGFREYQPNLPDTHPAPSVPARVHLQDPVLGTTPPGAARPPQGGAAAADTGTGPAGPDIHAGRSPGGAAGPGRGRTGATGRQGPSAGVQSGPEKPDGNG